MLTVLHLSDLHFGCERDPQGESDRRLVLEQLSMALEDVDRDWKPTVVCTTGDVGWRGADGDYVGAAEWYRALGNLLKIGSERLFFCPGNHDADLAEARHLERFADASIADEVLKAPVPEPRNRPFAAFQRFCQQLSVPPYLTDELGGTSYLWGTRSVGGLRVTACNTAWCTRGSGQGDRGSLWIGKRLLDHLRAHHLAGRKAAEFTVALAHHPPHFLADQETTAQIDRPAAWDVLASHSHLILTGHTHGAVRHHDQVAGQAFALSAGATMAGANHPNHVRLIRFQDTVCEYRTLQYDPSRASQPWSLPQAPVRLDLKQVGVAAEARSTAATSVPVLTNYRRAMRQFAADFLATKQQAARRTRARPAIVELPVIVVPEQIRHADHLRKARNRQESRPDERRLSDAVGVLSFLLGDMGSGKSTAVAELVQALSSDDYQGLAILVPAKRLLDGAIRSPRDLLSAVSAFVANVIAPQEERLDLVDLAMRRVELHIVIDGLDELPRQQAIAIAEAAAQAASTWAEVIPLLTGRPIELQGLEYRGWQILHTRSLADDDIRRIFVAEAKVDTENPSAAEELARDLMQRVARSAALRPMLATPLAIRMLFDTLTSPTSSASATLGDLVGQSCLARVGVWAEKDNKTEPFEKFRAAFPDSHARLALLARLVAMARREGGGALARPAALDEVEELARGAGIAEARQVANEAIASFETAGLLVDEAGLRVPLLAVEQYLVGYDLARSWRAGITPDVDPIQDWRSLAFAAAATRVLGGSPLGSRQLDASVDSLTAQPGGVPASAILVSESKEAPLAKRWIDRISLLEWRPLRLFTDESSESVRALAEAIHLAQRQGFEWMVTHYLQPIDPSASIGERTFDDVFQHWASIAEGLLGEVEKERLERYAAAHLGQGTWAEHAILPAIAVLIPERFRPAERFSLLTSLVWRSPLRFTATHILSEAAAGGDPDVRLALEAEALRGFEPAFRCATIWLAHFTTPPPPAILNAVLAARERIWTSEEEWHDALSECSQRLGEPRWTRLIRWLTFEETRAGSGAALVMVAAGERRLHVLRRVLYQALHDGGYVHGAKEALGQVLEEAGDEGYTWLAQQIGASAQSEVGGAHSRAWQLLLARLDAMKEGGPALLELAVPGATGFLLPRYADIRGGLGRLLRGDDGRRYAAMLERCLSSHDPLLRHGAAMILTVTEPSGYPLAVEETVRSADGRSMNLEHEWVPLLSSLELGPTASHLSRIAAGLPPRARALARMLAWQAGVLDAGSREELVLSLLREPLYHTDDDVVRKLLGSSSGRQTLVDALHRGVGGEAIRAAAFLLQWHAEQLSPEDRGRCDALTLTRSTLDVRLFAEALARAKDAHWRQGVNDVADERRRNHKGIPLISELLVAKEEGQWGGSLASVLFGSEDGLSDSHLLPFWVTWLLGVGRTHDVDGRAIGESAAALRSARKDSANQVFNEVAWLALLAHEFGRFDTDSLREALNLVPRRTTDAELRVALQARLDLANAEPSLRLGGVAGPPRSPAPWALLPEKEVDGAAFAELVRSSRDFPEPSVDEAFRSVLWKGSGSLVTLVPDEGAGLNYALIRGGLSWLETGRVDLPCVLAGIPSVLEAYELPQERCRAHLIRVWGQVHLGGAQHDPALRTQLVSRFRAEVIDPSRLYRDTGASARGLLLVRGQLEPDEVPPVLQDVAAHWEHDFRGVMPALVEWLGTRQLAPETREALRGGLLSAIAAIDADAGYSDQGWEPIVPISVTVASWALGAPLDERSARVFVRGLAGYFQHDQLRRAPDWRKSQTELRGFANILAQVPRDVLSGALRHGVRHGLPEERAACSLFLAAFDSRAEAFDATSSLAEPKPAHPPE